MENRLLGPLFHNLHRSQPSRPQHVLPVPVEVLTPERQLSQEHSCRMYYFYFSLISRFLNCGVSRGFIVCERHFLFVQLRSSCYYEAALGLLSSRASAPKPLK